MRTRPLSILMQIEEKSIIIATFRNNFSDRKSDDALFIGKMRRIKPKGNKNHVSIFQ